METLRDPSQPGRYIVLDGGEGSGKSTQVPRLISKLGDCGIAALPVREPGGTAAGEALRSVLLHSGANLDRRTQFLILSAARSQLMTEVVLPAINQGVWVVSDRSWLSSLAYQGHGLGESLRLIRTISRLATFNVTPDLILIFDVPFEVGLNRRNARGLVDRFEVMESAFHRSVRAGFIREAKRREYPIIDASRTIQEVEQSVWAQVAPLMSHQEE
jgi:dTMP kinase